MKTIQVQLAITLDETAARTFAELLSPAIIQSLGVSAKTSDERSDVRFRASQNAMFGSKEPDDQGIIIDYKEAARLLKVSQRTVWRMHTRGKMPPPIRIGRAIRWSLEVLKKWVAAGCPADPG